MNIIITIIILVILGLILGTDLFHLKVRKNIDELHYAATKDMWYKKEGNKKLIICLHGMYSTPQTFVEFAEQFNGEGWDVYLPALPASARTLEELEQIGPWTWKESLAIARKKILEASKGYETVILGGHSQGGSLTLALVPDLPFIKGVFIIASPVSLYGNHISYWKNIGIFFSGLLHFVVPKGIKEKTDTSDERLAVENICDAEGIFYPLTLHTFKLGLKKMLPRLREIHQPLFLAYEKGDTMVNFSNMEKIAQSVSSVTVVEKVFDTSKSEEPYGYRHQLLNYKPTKLELFKALNEFIGSIG
ncbi:Esterase/lipase [Brevinema andersonii]|uniref:Esterase/lipase n=1 Tax=Brevinema andersonii TaxID=34097 RepID=A0A1I1F8F0_BREAD|nr:alpha/beta hydrolase [Brevinema andersonii]SFB95226.1 Esterase/lipase [Brevinema andersonii]